MMGKLTNKTKGLATPAQPGESGEESGNTCPEKQRRDEEEE
jgi:hypothetical protein